MNDDPTESPTPDLAALRSNNDQEWQVAYPLLWTAAMGSARARLWDEVDIENLVSELLCKEVIPGVIEQRSVSFLQLKTFEDLLRLTRAIAVRRAIDEIRKRSRRKEVLVADIPEKEWSPDANSDGSKLWSDWMELIHRELKPPDPDLFHDRFALGLTTREIATNRGMPHGTVVSRFARALKRLSSLLGARPLDEVGE